MTAKKRAHAQKVIQLPMFGEAVTEATVFTRRAVCNLRIGDALISGRLTLVRDYDVDNKSGTHRDRYTLAVGGLKRKAWYASGKGKRESTLAEIARWLDAHGYDRQAAHTVPDYAYEDAV